jgi:hypothetical protein
MNIHDFYRPFQLHFRRKRMAKFRELFGIHDEQRILDVGGTPFNWALIDEKPKVVLLNVEATSEPDTERFTFVQGDARALPYDSGEFELVYSNSVIEHVGSFEDQKRFAQEIRRTGAAYYVQTPYKWFPIEPHFITLGVQFLPFAIKRKLLKWFSVWGLMTRPSQETTDAFIREIRLLTVKEMRQLFPDAEIHVERLLFLTKSIMAVKRPQPRVETPAEPATASR